MRTESVKLGPMITPLENDSSFPKSTCNLRLSLDWQQPGNNVPSASDSFKSHSVKNISNFTGYTLFVPCSLRSKAERLQRGNLGDSGYAQTQFTRFFCFHGGKRKSFLFCFSAQISQVDPGSERADFPRSINPLSNLQALGSLLYTQGFLSLSIPLNSTPPASHCRSNKTTMLLKKH